MNNMYCRSMPEHNLLALRELRARCSGLEEVYHDELARYQREWAEQKEVRRQLFLSIIYLLNILMYRVSISTIHFAVTLSPDP